ncbi:helix-turn-helix domain-containing protein, partial [Rhodothermus marinus]|uniref:helix-turn-helix domain-containing protein n=1 Tax=Rhodothermus marinus TaxID=29549 RepID=UPI000A4F1FBD
MEDDGETRSQTDYEARAPRGARASAGIVSLAARRLGVDRRTVYYHLSRDRKLQRELEEVRRLAVLMAEQVVFERVREGDMEAVRMILKSQLGAPYGWSERRSVALKHKADFPTAIRVEVVRPEPARAAAAGNLTGDHV